MPIFVYLPDPIIKRISAIVDYVNVDVTSNNHQNIRLKLSYSVQEEPIGTAINSSSDDFVVD